MPCREHSGPARGRHPFPTREVVVRRILDSEWAVTLGLVLLCATVIAALNM